MKSRSTIENLLIMLALLVSLNYWIFLWHKPQRLKLLNRLETTERIETLFLGDSTISIGLLRPVFERVWMERRGEDCHMFNSGVPDSTAIAHYLTLRKGIRHHPEIKRVVYGAIGFRLTDRMFGPAESVAQNVFLEYYQEPEVTVAFHRELRWLGGVAFEVERRIPMFVERQSFWVKVEKLRRRLERWGLARAATTGAGRQDDFVNYLHSDFNEFLDHCNQTADARAGLWAPIREMGRFARENGVELTVVYMPMSREHRRKFYSAPEWRRYLAHVRRELEMEGVKMIDATDWVDLPDFNAFPDDLHMTGQAAEMFSRKIAEVLSGP